MAFDLFYPAPGAPVSALDGDGFDVRGSPTARVKYALRSDDLLSEADVR